MRLSFRSKKYYAYCGDSEKSTVSEVFKSNTGVPALKVLSSCEGKPTSPEVIETLVDKAEASPGKVSVAFPLHLFEVVNLSLPMMPEEAIERAMPYHLSKAFDKPLGDYIYDWQIYKKQKDSLQMAVYLFPLEKFQKITQEFEKKDMEVTHFEADVFAASAYLDMAGRLTSENACICAVIWRNSLSFAVVENGRLVLTRDVMLERPCKTSDDCIFELEDEDENEISYSPDLIDDADIEVDMAFEVETQEDAKAVGYDQGDSILAGFDILAGDTIAPEVDMFAPEVDTFVPEEESLGLVLELENNEGELEESIGVSSEVEVPMPVIEVRTPLDDYLDEVCLEIIRTRDYYTSVIKGKPVKAYFVLGAEVFFDQLNEVIQKTIGENIEMVVDTNVTSDCEPVLYAVGLGTGYRW